MQNAVPKTSRESFMGILRDNLASSIHPARQFQPQKFITVLSAGPRFSNRFSGSGVNVKGWLQVSIASQRHIRLFERGPDFRTGERIQLQAAARLQTRGSAFELFGTESGMT